MIKTIKIKKQFQFRLDELIKYVWDNDIKEKDFYIQSERDANHPRYLTVDVSGMIRFSFSVYPNDTFTVEVEEEITEHTVFQSVVIIDSNRINHLPPTKYYSIRSVRRDYPTVTEIHAIINGKLQLIWEPK